MYKISTMFNLRSTRLVLLHDRWCVPVHEVDARRRDGSAWMEEDSI